MAIAAEVDVLPTPPCPTQTTTREARTTAPSSAITGLVVELIGERFDPFSIGADRTEVRDAHRRHLALALEARRVARLPGLAIESTLGGVHEAEEVGIALRFEPREHTRVRGFDQRRQQPV